MELKNLEGKTIKSIETPDNLKIEHTGDTTTYYDDNIIITFTDGTILKLASWDAEGYSSGIYKQVIQPAK